MATSRLYKYHHITEISRKISRGYREKYREGIMRVSQAYYENIMRVSQGYRRDIARVSWGIAGKYHGNIVEYHEGIARVS